MSGYNPTETQGFDFLEFATTDAPTLIAQFNAMGFTPIAENSNKQVIIFQQNDIRFIINTLSDSQAEAFAFSHAASVSAMGFKVNNAEKAYQHVIKHGAKAYDNLYGNTPYNIPAIYGVGNSLIYFVDYINSEANYAPQFKKIQSAVSSSNEKGLAYIDHVTHNLHRGHMSNWAEFYETLFNFKEIRYFDIEGKLTGLKSKAMVSPCGKIRIPLNESSDNKSQIEEFLKDFNGEGIQHIALGSNDIYKTVEELRQNHIQFLDTPDTYYELINQRLPNHGEQSERLKSNRILIDGTTKESVKILLQIFTKNMLGPVFFEIIQRKGDEGFGEGNFRALFESIELDQIRRGVLTDDKVDS